MDDLNMKLLLGAYSEAFSRNLKLLQKNKIGKRIWSADYTVWKPNPTDISNRLGWLTAPADTLQQLSYISSVINPVVAEGYKNAVLLGMGGSSLAASVFCNMLPGRLEHPGLSILDTTDPSEIIKIKKPLDLKKTIFLVSSKSGTTLETVLLFNYFYNLLREEKGKAAGRNFMIITDPGSPLEDIAHRLKLRHVFLSNPAVGGRYSALSFSGIVPAALAGINVEAILKNAFHAAVDERTSAAKNLSASRSVVLGTALATLAQKDCNKLTFILPPSWALFGNWLEQLIAESTGKEKRGILPVCGEPLYSPEEYGSGRLFVIFCDKEQTDTAKVSALAAAGHPVIKLEAGNSFQLGEQIFLWEMATAVASHILGINPFDQPDVESSKILTRRIIDLYRDRKELPQEKPTFMTKECNVYGFTDLSSPDRALADFLAGAQKSAYACLQAYLPNTPETDAALHRLRTVITKKYRLAVTISYGPRYLHSTGQLYKGDAGEGIFVQFTADDPCDLPIPSEPGSSVSHLTFGSLKLAQAIGDRQAMINSGRKVIRFHLKRNIIAVITALSDFISRQ